MPLASGLASWMVDGSEGVPGGVGLAVPDGYLHTSSFSRVFYLGACMSDTAIIETMHVLHVAIHFFLVHCV